MRERRPAFFENLVYGLALLLALIVGFYALKAFLPAPSQRPGAAPGIAPKERFLPSERERAVSSLPPMRIFRPGRSRARPSEVPLPGSQKDLK